MKTRIETKPIKGSAPMPSSSAFSSELEGLKALLPNNNNVIGPLEDRSGPSYTGGLLCSFVEAGVLTLPGAALDGSAMAEPSVITSSSVSVISAVNRAMRFKRC
jgi:hypothetical protein